MKLNPDQRPTRLMFAGVFLYFIAVIVLALLSEEIEQNDMMAIIPLIILLAACGLQTAGFITLHKKLKKAQNDFNEIIKRIKKLQK